MKYSKLRSHTRNVILRLVAVMRMTITSKECAQRMNPCSYVLLYGRCYARYL